MGEMKENEEMAILGKVENDGADILLRGCRKRKERGLMPLLLFSNLVNERGKKGHPLHDQEEGGPPDGQIPIREAN